MTFPSSSLLVPAATVRAYRGAYAPHSHGHAQVLLGLQGSLQLEVDGHAAFVDPSCGLVIPAGSSHGYLADSLARVLVVDCLPEQGIDRLRRFALPQTWLPQRAATMDATDLLRDVLGAPTLLPRRRLDLEVVARHVDARLHHDWTLAELAGLCGFSPQRFRARFGELVGSSPLAWVRQRRLEAAVRLLRGGLSLEATALQVGYASASALGFALRRERGLGARQLRTRSAAGRAFLDS